jgi:hypothetical protein
VSYNSSVFSTNQLYTDSGKLFKHPLSFDRPVGVQLCAQHQGSVG